MRAVLLLLVTALAVVVAKPPPSRIVGGTLTTIDRWPMGVSMLQNRQGAFRQTCGGSILTIRSVLSAAHCFIGNNVNNWRMRIGSTMGNSGGVVHNTARWILHPAYNRRTFDSDVAVLHTVGTIALSNNARVGPIAGANYNVPDRTPVWAIGWGAIFQGGPLSEQLRQVQVWTVNQDICRQRYSRRGTITENMLCSGYLDVGGRDQCQGDSGGPLLHNNVVIGVCSFGHGCASPNYPGVNVRVSRFTNWIIQNSS